VLARRLFWRLQLEWLSVRKNKMAQRLIVLTGSLQVSGYASANTGTLAELIRQTFTNAGWSLSSVRLTQQIINPSILNITIEANVFDTFTAEQARQTAANLLATGFVTTAGLFGIGGGNPLFSNVALQILNEGALPNAVSDTTNSGLYSALTQVANAAAGIAKTGVENAAANTGLGLSLPIAAVGILIVIMVMKK